MKTKTILLLAASALLVSSCALKGNEKGNNTDVIQIGVVSKGYGHSFIDQLVKEYNKRDNVTKAELVYSGPNVAYPDQRLQLPNNQVDLFFSVSNTVFATQSNASKTHWADLSDVYDSPLVGYKEAVGDAKIKDYIDPSFLNSFTFSDGKQYAVPFTSGAVGLLYNKTKWDLTNERLKQAGKKELVLPKTTNQMFDLFDTIKTSDVKTASGGTYAFSYSGVNSYMHFMFNSLWPQYLGPQASENFFKGQDENGVYTADIYKTDARKYAYSTIRKMILQSNGYVSSSALGTTYDLEQVSFLRGNAFFSCNGDWMEREASKQFNPGDADIEMIRTPIMSEIVNNPVISSDFTGSSSTKERKLVSIIDYIDEHYISADEEITEAAATSLEVSLSTLEFINHARLTRHALPDFVATVAENSNQLEGAKDFLKFMLSKQGQEIVMDETYGCATPMTIDYTQTDYYKYGTYYSKSRLNIVKKSVSYGNAMNYPMEFLAKCTPCADLKIASAFGGKDPVTAESFMMEEYNDYNSTWADKMAIAGVNNN